MVRLVGTVLFVVAVPLFLIATNARWVINAPRLYSYGFDKYDSPSRTDIERSELLSAARQIRDYFNNDEDRLDVRVVQEGVLQSIFDQRETLHMQDVKGLVRDVYWIQEVAGVYLALFALVGLLVVGRGFVSELGRYLRFGGSATLGLVALVGIGALVGFERLFLAFHQVSFSNDLWQLDPRTDDLIKMFPEGFFLDATLLIAGFTIVEALLLTIIPWLLLRRTRRVRREIPGAIEAEAASELGRS